MNYENIYNQIIEKARSENRLKANGVYYESHHIVPKCIGGTNEDSNKVLLLGREHFVCHKLLVEIYPHKKGLFLAKWNMAHCRKTERLKNYKVSSREYERLRIEFSESQTGEKHFLFGKHHSDESKLKMSQMHLGRIVSDETRKKLSINSTGENNGMFGMTGELNGMFGRKHTDKAKKMMSDAVKNRIHKPHSKKTKAKMSASAKLVVRTPGHIENLKRALQNRSKESALKASETKKNFPILRCPYCGTESRGKSNMTRYHFDKCKSRPEDIQETDYLAIENARNKTI